MGTLDDAHLVRLADRADERRKGLGVSSPQRKHHTMTALDDRRDDCTHDRLPEPRVLSQDVLRFCDRE